MPAPERSDADRQRVERLRPELEKRGLQVVFAEDRNSALSTLLGMIPRGSSIAHGSSTTLKEIGFIDYLMTHRQDYRYLNPEWMAEGDKDKRKRLRAELSVGVEYYLGGIQAICETGEALGADAGGSRLAFYMYGPPHIIWVTGVNKIVSNLEEGLKRIRDVALPLEDRRVKSTGGSGSYVGKIAIFEKERPGRIAIVFVGESLGY